LFIVTLHPQIMGQRFLWTCGQPIDSEDGSFEAFQTQEFRRSHIRFVIDNRVPLRRKLADDDCPLADLSQLVPPLTRVVEARALQRKASVLLNTYVGTHAGARVLAGQIRRGDTTSINAAIWPSDMRGQSLF
jgi:adenylate cyclase